MEYTKAVIPIEEICHKILKKSVLDIFYLIIKDSNLSQADIKQKFAQYDPEPNAKATKYRSHIEIGIACLESVLFIDSWQDGTALRYYLTPYGKIAKAIVTNLMEEIDETMLLGSIVVKKVIEGDINNV
ncbi:hypothetical protein [Bacillus sp. FJAT-28004]|uniref:hypothetical protein n=1 Tax=Bacillus sp. FJAT-28004 TaxID=1679165 RepID=UPI0006B599CD|nr:hypothetical protein [Bacillus sp. FJAT-28004]